MDFAGCQKLRLADTSVLFLRAVARIPARVCLMSLPTVAQLIPVLQTAIGPMILISGVGLLLLSMTNRLGRVIDRLNLQ